VQDDVESVYLRLITEGKLVSQLETAGALDNRDVSNQVSLQTTETVNFAAM